MISQRFPLPEEEKLAKGVADDFPVIRRPSLLQLERIPVPERGGPLGPRPQVVEVLEGHEEREIVKPFAIGGAESFELLGELPKASSFEPCERRFEQRQLPGDHRPVVDVVFWKLGTRSEVFGGYQPIVQEEIRTDQVCVAGEGGEALVGRICVPGRTER